MPRLCRETVAKQLETMTYLKFLAEPGNNACEFVADKMEFLGIWGEFDIEEVIEPAGWLDLGWWKECLFSLWAPDQMYFKFVVHVMIGMSCYFLGLLTRRSRLADLRDANQRERTKSAQVMQQLWSSMEENIQYKGEREKLKLEMTDVKRDLQLALNEKEVIQTKNWGLERNMKIIQSERDALDGKIKNILTLSEMPRSFGSGGTSQTPIQNDDLRSISAKFQNLQGLVKELLRAHRNEKATMLEAMANASGV